MELLQGRHELPLVEELEQRRALPAGHDETSDLVELPGQPHLDRLDPEPVEGLLMEAEVALQGEHADAHGCAPDAAPYQPRVWSRSDSLSLEVSMPCMASPRSSETLARMSASLYCVVACTMALARVAGSEHLKMPEPTNTA